MLGVHRSYYAAELSLLINQSNLSPKNRSQTYDELISFWERLYGEEFKDVDNLGREKIIGDFREFINSKFYLYSVDDSQNLETDVNAKDRKEEQRIFLLGLIERFSKIGSLDELLIKENNNVSKLNSFFKIANLFPKVSKESLTEAIENLNLNSIQDGLKLDVMLLHFIGFFKEIYEEFTYASIELGAYGIDRIKDVSVDIKKFYKSKLHQFAEEYVRNPEDEETYRRLETFLKLIKPNNSKSYISSTINGKNPKMHQMIDAMVDKEKITGIDFEKMSEYSKKIYKSVESFYNEYQQLVKNSQKNDINPPTFEEYFREILKIYNIEKSKVKYKRASEFKIIGKFEDNVPRFDDDAIRIFINKLKSGKSGLPFLGNGEDSELTASIIDFIWTEEKKIIFSDTQNTLINLIRDIDMKNRLEQVQNFYFKSILGVYRKKPDLVNLRNVKTDKEQDNFVEIVLPRTLQVFKYPYGENNLTEEDKLAIETIPVARKTDVGLDTAISCNSFKTNIPRIDELDDEQTKCMVELLNTLTFIETRSRRKVSNNPLLKIQEILKINDRKFQRALKLRGCMAKGMERYIREHTALEDKFDVISKEDKDTADVMIEIQTSSKVAPERFFSKYFKINSDKMKEYCFKKYRQKAYLAEERVYAQTVESVISDVELIGSISYEGANTEKEKTFKDILEKTESKEKDNK